MKNLLIFGFLFSTLLFTACGDDDTDEHMHADEAEYEIHIDSPNSEDKHVGDVLSIKVNVHDHNGNTVHNVSFRIYNVDTNEEIYNPLGDAHVHEEDGSYDFEEDFTLDVDPHTDWMFEAKAWNADGTHEVMEEVPFHVHP